jgi:hypothetical protein
MIREALAFSHLLEICDEIDGGTLSITLPPGAPYVPPWPAAVRQEVRIGSEDLAATFAGVLKAHKSENLLEGAKHMQKVRVGSESVANRY